jgi:hypothetical protein
MEEHMRRLAAALTLLSCCSALCAADAPPWSPHAEGTRIDLTKAPAPLFDDPVWHAPTDPDVLWNPIKHEWTMYYTQRRGTLENTNGVDWVHGTAIGIATSPDGVTWKYQGVCQGDQGLGDPLKDKVTWWAPGLVWDGDTLHMFVTWVDGIYTRWEGKRFIKHFTSTDGVNFKYVSTLKLSSERCIDAMVYKTADTWHLVYKDEAAGSHIFTVSSKDLNEWSDPRDILHDVSQEGPWVIRWKDAWWMISDPLRQPGLRVYKSDNGIDNWTFNNAILQQPGRRPDDQRPGAHPAVIVQGDKAIIYYFVDGGKKTVIQIAELELGADGKVLCNRDKYAAAATNPADGK